MLRTAQRAGYAVGTFDLVSLETGQALLDPAESRHSPIILMVGEEAGSDWDGSLCKVTIYTDIVQRAAKELHDSLSRGDDLLDWLRAISIGFREVAASYLELFRAAGRARDITHLNGLH